MIDIKNWSDGADATTDVYSHVNIERQDHHAYSWVLEWIKGIFESQVVLVIVVLKL
jgi:hypothetical protein